jgi:hypothetical protein
MTPVIYSLWLMFILCLLPANGQALHAICDITSDILGIIMASGKPRDSNDSGNNSIWLGKSKVAHPDDRAIYAGQGCTP